MNPRYLYTTLSLDNSRKWKFDFYLTGSFRIKWRQ